MAKKKSVKKEIADNEVDDLRIYAAEADQVELIKKTQGWGILERDLVRYKDEISARIAYLDPKSKEFSEARILYIASDKLLKMFDDYSENKKRALELLNRLENTKENIVLDVDN